MALPTTMCAIQTTRRPSTQNSSLSLGVGRRHSMAFNVNERACAYSPDESFHCSKMFFDAVADTMQPEPAPQVNDSGRFFNDDLLDALPQAHCCGYRARYWCDSGEQQHQ
jgi:hypothetical protein